MPFGLPIALPAELRAVARTIGFEPTHYRVITELNASKLTQRVFRLKAKRIVR
jgi:hypothetical protein